MKSRFLDIDSNNYWHPFKGLSEHLMKNLKKIIGFSYLMISFVGFTDAQERTLQDYINMLDDKPTNLWITIENREYWEQVKQDVSYEETIKTAKTIATNPVPNLADSLYLLYLKTGNRDSYEAVYSQIRGNIYKLVFAECLQNKEKFIPAIEKHVDKLCSYRSWVLPAHDRELKTFNGEHMIIDLGVAMSSWETAATYNILGNKLSDECREQIILTLSQKTFDPFLKMMRTGENLELWLPVTNNWNAVCLGGILGAGLSTIVSKEERAELLLAADKYHNYPKGFSADGYCSEGLGYWNYGMHYYIRLIESIKAATHEKRNLILDNLEVMFKVALYPNNLNIQDNIFPAYADCPIEPKPSSTITNYFSNLFNIDYNFSTTQTKPLHIFETYRFLPQYIQPLQVQSKQSNTDAMHSEFKDAGIYTLRNPNPNALQISLKGGSNDETHNHNDVGNYVVVKNGKRFVLDVGREVYTARTFNDHRYESNVMNSYGHSVPVVDGLLQEVGAQSKAVLLKKVFTDLSDTITFDISSAYPSLKLTKLVRTFIYSRTQDGSFSVIDSVEYNDAAKFETAIITLSEIEILSDNALIIKNGDYAIRAEIDANTANFEIAIEEIKEDLPNKLFPKRISVKLKEEIKDGMVRINFSPVE